MRSLYLNCENGICIDMVLSAFKGILEELGKGSEFFEMLEGNFFCRRGEQHGECQRGHCDEHGHGRYSHCHGQHKEDCGHEHGDEDCKERHGHGHHGHCHKTAQEEHGRSYMEICHEVRHASISEEAKSIVLSIYNVIAKAEAAVHEETLETVHFHEVGRKKAVENVTKIAICLLAMEVDEILCSDIHDGKGFIECSHGTIPVPVPAVCEIKKLPETLAKGYIYKTENVETEMVTPTGLGVLVGIGAYNAKMPKGRLLAEATGFGNRNTGRGGLVASLIEQ